MFFKESRQAAAADLSCPFDYESDIARQFRPRFQISFYRFEMRQVLPFIIASATREQRSALDPWLKRRRLPQFERLRRLHIIMAIHHKMCPPGSAGIPAGEFRSFEARRQGCRRSQARRLRHHNRVSLSWAEPCLQTYLLALPHQQFGASVQM